MFDSEWRARCCVTHISHAQASNMIGMHYLHKWPGVPTCVLGMWDGILLVGLCVFALPPRETSVRYGGETWELARLWIKDEVPRNAETWLIAQAIKHIKRIHTEVKMLVSYADPSAGHSGTIYRAGNWTQDGRTDEGRKTPRIDYICWGRKYSRRAHVPEGAPMQRVPRVSKYRFTYRLGRESEAARCSIAR